MKTIIKDLKGIATWYTVKPPLMATIFHSRTGVPPFFFRFLFQTGLLYSQTCFIPKKWCHTSRSISPYWPFSKRLLQLCSQLDSRFSFLQLLIQFKCMIFKQSLSFIHHWKDYLFMNYQRKKISQGYGFPSNARPNFFLVSFFPTAYCYDTAYYIILHYFLHTSDCNRYFGQHETLSSKTK